MEQKYPWREVCTVKRLYVYCEGDTEAKFVEGILRPFLNNYDKFIIRPIICETKRTPEKKFKGGISNYAKIKNELIRSCKKDTNAYFTTMFDYYRFPINTLGINTAIKNIDEKMQYFERAIEVDLGGLPNLFFNLTAHEFEGLLFSDINAFKDVAKANDKTLAELRRIRNDFPSPEDINNSEATAPSKRITRILPGYSKTLNGIEVANRIGIAKTAEQCQHFKQWLAKIEKLANGGTL